MTSPSSLQPDLARVVQRAAGNGADMIADLTARLAMSQEMNELQGARIRELEQEATEAAAELARARQTAEQLQQQIDELEHTGADGDRAAGQAHGDAGTQPEEGPGEG